MFDVETENGDKQGRGARVKSICTKRGNWVKCRFVPTNMEKFQEIRVFGKILIRELEQCACKDFLFFHGESIGAK